MSMRSLARRGAARDYQKPPIGQSLPFPAPTLGMNTRDSIAALDPREARSIENMIVESGKCEIRKGETAHETVSGASSIGTLFTHVGVASNVILAGASDGHVYDVTGTPSSLASGYTLSTWSMVQFNDTTVAVNGTDTPFAFDGSAIGASGLSGSGLTISNLRTVNVVGTRMWFTENAQAWVWYLANDAVTGVLTKFHLEEETLGGYCVGIYGFGPYTVFVMSSGEIVTYQGDPGSDFSFVKRYKAPVPVGYDPGIDVAGDLVVMTTSGPLPFEAIAAGLGFDSVDLASWGKIAPSWAADFISYGGNAGWNATFFQGLVIFNIPTDSTTAKQWIFNTRTKAWSFFSNVPAYNFAENSGTLYFGSKATNKVFKYQGSTDNGDAIEAIIRGSFSYPFQNRVKGVYSLMQIICTTTGAVTAQLQVDVELKETGISAPEVSIATAGSGPWGEAWGSAWGMNGEAITRWSKIHGIGRAVAPVVKFHSQADDLKFLSANVIGAPAGVL